jgi:guanosine-3',5'-bis(diphosphate) 3'-pyrophosphohydrolase
MQWQELRSHLRHLSEEDLHRVQAAFLLGQRAHDGQLRKSGEPYFVHPIAVAHMLADMGADRDTIIAALLHDTVEDTNITLPHIRMEFGETVAELIDGLTKLERGDIGERASLDEQIETLRKIFTLMQQDVRIMVVKLIDRLHNMQTVEFLSPEKQRALAQETLDVYVKIADRLSMQDIRDELELLSEQVLEPESTEVLLALRMSNERLAKKVIPEMQHTLKETNPALLKELNLHQEYKTWQELQKQRERGKSAVTGMSDLIITFECPNTDDCYRTLGALHQQWQRETLSFQDYINSPLINGYKGLHTTVILEDGTRVRCKIRTHEMQQYSRKGITTYCFDKRSKDPFQHLPWAARISTVSDDTTNRSAEFWESLQSDILGESIVIHVPTGEALQIPKGATALDGAFYIFGEKALRLAEVKVNGTAVSFGTPLENAASLEVKLNGKQTVHREWLESAQTHTAIAIIRRGLAAQDRPKKIAAGQELLNRYFTEKRRGFLEEFNEKKLDQKLRLAGFGSTAQTYVGIAEGRISPREIDETLFPSSEKQSQPKRYTLLCKFPARLQGELMEELEPFLPSRVQFAQEQEGVTACRAILMLTPEQSDNLQRAVVKLLETEVQLRPLAVPLVTSLLCVTLFLLWGLDPVAAYWILHHTPIGPIELHIIRSITLTVISTIAIGILALRQHIPLSRLPIRSVRLWLSALCLFIVSLSTYFSLQHTLPGNYSILMTAAGMVAVEVSRRSSALIRLVVWLFYGIGLIVLVTQSPDWHWSSIALTICAVLSFTGFSILGEQYKKREHVSARIGQYFFFLTVTSLLFSIVLLPYSSFAQLSVIHIAIAAGFTAVFTCLPYALYYLSDYTYATAVRYSLAVVPITLIGQTVFIHAVNLVTLGSAILVGIGAILPLLWGRTVR